MAMKIRWWLAVAAALTGLTLSSCAPIPSDSDLVARFGAGGFQSYAYFTLPKVTVLHSPMQPTNSQAVTYTAKAHAPLGVSVIKIWRWSLGYGKFCVDWVGGQCVPLKGPQVTLIKTCNFPEAPVDAVCAVQNGPYADGSFITYGATTRDIKGNAAEDRWIGFAAGAYPTPNDPIPIYVRGDPATSVDIVFVPDKDYVTFLSSSLAVDPNAQFKSDVERFVTQGYFVQPAVSDSRDRWNFYVTYKPGVAVGYMVKPPAGYVSCQNTFPSNWTTLAATVDAAAFVHTRTTDVDGNVFRDCSPPPAASGPNPFSITSSGTVSTIVHETGHAVFALSDEYCCDGGIITNSWPDQNMFTSQSACQTSAVAHGVPIANCVQLTTTVRFCGGTNPDGTPAIGGPGSTNNQWAQDVAGDLMGCGANSGAAAGTLDERRVYWYYDHL
jgi:hypothetical protein